MITRETYARENLRAGPFSGVPFLIKDLGSPFMSAYPIEQRLCGLEG